MPGAVIRYTLDQTAPSATVGALYTTPLSITTTTIVRAIAYTPDNSFAPSTIAANSYFFIDHILDQTAPIGYPNTWSSYPADYDMDPEIVTSATYAPVITDALLALPTLSIAMDVDDLFGSSAGIYTHPLQDGPTWERPSSVELIFPDGQPGFQINAGIRIFGGASRTPSNSPKHSFRLLFKADYGPTKLTFPLFDDSATDEFDTLVPACRIQQQLDSRQPHLFRRRPAHPQPIHPRPLGWRFSTRHGAGWHSRNLCPPLPQRPLLGHLQYARTAQRLISGSLLRRRQGRI
ncbi:MAG: FN3 associated domain-containing protein [Chloroflexota bacterium]